MLVGIEAAFALSPLIPIRPPAFLRRRRSRPRCDAGHAPKHDIFASVIRRIVRKSRLRHLPGDAGPRRP